MSNPILEVIQTQDEINKQAYDTFLQDYERRNPPPKTDSRFVLVVMYTSAIASMIVSGAFTIPTFERILISIGANTFLALSVGVSGFILFDLMLLAMGYKITDMIYRPQALKGDIQNTVVLRNMGIIFMFGFVVSFGSNLYYVNFGLGTFAEGSDFDQALKVLLGTLLAFAPAVQSSAIGAMIALIPLNKILELDAYESNRNRQWSRYKSKNGLNLDVDALTQKYIDSRLSAVSSVVVSEQTDSRQTAYERVSSATDIAIEYLKSNPQDMNKSLRELADIIGVGKDSVAKAKKML